MNNIMKIFLALVLFSPTAFAGNYLLMPIDEVYDGDTIKTHISKYRLTPPLNILRVRIYGIDTPEMPAKSYATTGKLSRAKCVKEAELALQARAAVEQLVVGPTKMKVTDFKWGKYGGRVLGNVSIGGVDIATYLIEKGLAVPYFGSGTKKDWCL